MKTDWTLLTQSSFRKLLKAFSQPGSIQDLSAELKQMDQAIPIENILVLVARTLLDPETSFSVVGRDTENWASWINRLTYCRPVPPEQRSSFVFTDARTDSGFVSDAVSLADSGDLIDPQLGSTVIVLVQDFIGKDVLLSGPGIKTTTSITLPFYDLWKQVRDEKVKEFPLGIDMLFITPKGSLIGIPRTTKITPVFQEVN